MSKYKCCMYCYEQICHEDIETAHLWPTLCGYAFKSDGYLTLKLDHSLEEELEILEYLGFVTTHETNEEMIVRMEGVFTDAEMDCSFCIDLERHSREV